MSATKQLLSALAAIERAKTALSVIQNYALDEGGDWRVHDTAQSAIKSIQNVDLSLLHEHDAEVRKPLVDALSDCAHLLAQEHIRHHGNCGGIDCPVFKASRKGFDTLAKVKGAP